MNRTLIQAAATIVAARITERAMLSVARPDVQQHAQVKSGSATITEDFVIAYRALERAIEHVEAEPAGAAASAATEQDTQPDFLRSFRDETSKR